jgi:hypothetical protein
MLNRLTHMASRAAAFTLLLFAAVPAQAGDPGMVMVAVGGGSVEGAITTTNSPVAFDATFSFHVGYDKHGEFKGSFHFKRVFPGSGVRAVMSTEITDFQSAFDEVAQCPWVRMSGTMTLHKTWGDRKPNRGEYFAVEAWDCEGVEGMSDMIWIGTYTDEALTIDRGALTFQYPVDLAAGNIMIR